jgi:hypothetical protein
MRWLRLYCEVVADPKVQRLPGDKFKRWINLLCVAGQHDGILPPMAENLLFPVLTKLLDCFDPAGLPSDSAGEVRRPPNRRIGRRPIPSKHSLEVPIAVCAALPTGPLFGRSAVLREHAAHSIAVGGLARCGTTLMMHMLHAGGIPCMGSKPDFEVDEFNNRPVKAAFLERHSGHAFKLLDPHRTPLPHGFRGVLVWLDRDPAQQAKSQAKFVHLMTGAPMANRAQLREWASTFGVTAGRPLPFLRGGRS